MMRNANHIFVDTNCLISYIGKKYGIVKDDNNSTEALQYLFKQNGKMLYVSSLSIAQLTAKLQKPIGVDRLTAELRTLLHKFVVLDFSVNEIKSALNDDNQLRDIEDSYQYYTAIKAKCFYIMTNNIRDFRSKYNIKSFTPKQVRQLIYD